VLTRRHLLAAGGAGALLSACALPTSDGRTQRVQLVAQPAEVALRGVAQPEVQAWTYGGDVPGPLIRARQGQRLEVDFHNRLPVASTVHWHGLRLPNAMDGVPGLTQPAVPPGGRFRYAFELPDAGTFWYHSHLRGSEQVERGLHGVLLVDEAQPPAGFDRELTWLIDDWRLARDGSLDTRFLQPHDVAHAGRLGNLVTVNGRLPRPVALRRGERIRLRLVNAANARIVALQFDGHRPLVVALDGHPVVPHEPPRGRVVLGPGMRADLLLEAVGEPGRRYAVGDVFFPRAAYDLLELAYEAAPLREPDGRVPVLAANPVPEPAAEGATRHVLTFEGGMMGALHAATLDGRQVPFMELARRGTPWAIDGVVGAGHEGGHGGHGGHGSHAMAPFLTVPRGRSVELVLRNDTRWFHPIHLHGHAFRLLRQGGREVAQRPWLDTVLLAPQEEATVAFVADNPGDWMLHCHVLEHHEGGMMGVLRVA
jgi:FtsP/CotA-like multicopper oxidase with cupredoxin domain